MDRPNPPAAHETSRKSPSPSGWLRTLLILAGFVLAGSAAGYLMSQPPTDVAGRDHSPPAQAPSADTKPDAGTERSDEPTG